MIKLNQILLPTDGSAASQKATAFAVALAQRFGARIIALHVTTLRGDLPIEQASFESGPDTVRMDMEQVEEEHRILQEVAEAGAQANVAVETICVIGSPREVIVRLVKERRFDLVVMGRRGRSGIHNNYLGPVAEKTVQAASCPVLVV
jgi:nucleotide-binding universal stress UspA family protein